MAAPHYVSVEAELGEIFEASRPGVDPDIPLERGLQEAIENQVEVCFAVKCNPDPVVLRTLADAGAKRNKPARLSHWNRCPHPV